MPTRRSFLTHTCGLGVAAATVSTAGLTLGMARSVSASTAPATGYKALVCILLAGGNDSYNMLAPYDDDQHDEYKKIRSDLALSKDDLLALDEIESGRTYGVHPGLLELKEIYDDQELAFVANVGTLIEPVDAAAVEAGTARVPIGLFSHSDQIAQWQSAISYQRTASYGWGGRMADLLDPDPANGLSMNISLSGTNLFQTGDRVAPYTIWREGDGANGVWTFPAFWLNGIDIEESVRDLLDVKHENILRREYKRRLEGAMDNRVTFVEAIQTAPEFETEFSENYFSRSLRQIARVIGARSNFGQTRQIFFLQAGGWDHHDDLLDNQNRMLPWVSKGLHEFRSALKEVNAFDDVATFTISDFGRTLTSNGKGSDHGWGGHQIVMGGGTKGGDIYGTYPEISDSSPLDVGRGIYIPTMSVEEYFGEIALWFGVSPSDLEEVLPRIRTFYSPESPSSPVGFLV